MLAAGAPFLCVCKWVLWVASLVDSMLALATDEIADFSGTLVELSPSLRGVSVMDSMLPISYDARSAPALVRSVINKLLFTAFCPKDPN